MLSFFADFVLLICCNDVTLADYDNLQSVLDAVEDGDVDAGLIDVNLAMYATNILNDYKGMITDEMVENSELLTAILSEKVIIQFFLDPFSFPPMFSL